jgi:hypothetical protein
MESYRIEHRINRWYFKSGRRLKFINWKMVQKRESVEKEMQKPRKYENT